MKIIERENSETIRCLHQTRKEEMAKNFFSGSHLNRISHRRGENLLREFEKNSKFVLLNNNRHLSKANGQIHWLTRQDLDLPPRTLEDEKRTNNLVFLGLDETVNEAYWAFDVTQDLDLRQSESRASL